MNWQLIAVSEEVEYLLDYWRRSPDARAFGRRIGFLEWAAETLRAIRFQRLVLKAFVNEDELVQLLRDGGIRI